MLIGELMMYTINRLDPMGIRMFVGMVSKDLLATQTILFQLDGIGWLVSQLWKGCKQHEFNFIVESFSRTLLGTCGVRFCGD